MRYLFSFMIFFFTAAGVFAQTDTYDLLTYARFKDSAGVKWTKEVAAGRITYTSTNTKANTWCQVFILKSIDSKGGIEKDFANDWQDFIVRSYKPTGTPQIEEVIDGGEWKFKVGRTKFMFNNKEALAALTTMTGHDRCVSVVIVTNSQVYTGSIQRFLASFDLKKPAGNVGGSKLEVGGSKPPAQNNTVQNTSKPNVSGGFQFSTSNFDDGWVSNAKADWAEVTKGNIKVLVHYPNKQADEYIPDLDKATANGWNVLVAPRYASASNMEVKPVSGYGSVQFIEADMVEKGTGRTVHVVLFHKHPNSASGVYIEFITPDKATFEKEFGAWHNTTDGWERMDKMAGYNRFAVAASDLSGKWTTNFTGTTHYVNVYTGNYSGMSSYSSRQTFVFGSGSTYNWELATAAGSTGNIKMDGTRSSGKFTMAGNWQVNFSDIERKARTFNVHFSCIKGGLRILWIDGRAYGKVE